MFFPFAMINYLLFNYNRIKISNSISILIKNFHKNIHNYVWRHRPSCHPKMLLPLFSNISEREICVDFNMYSISAFNIFMIEINKKAQREFEIFLLQHANPISNEQGNECWMFHSIKSNKLSIPDQFQFTRSRGKCTPLNRAGYIFSICSTKKNIT